ncbi:SSI family serine proteinase inhibitor [Amycolatopsis pigmentata]|uniref:SSI family serine proteinase inhibitor n=1 Tax=Amycolatopsis pigmentata TaxID=450801 RepID=A0ABW5G1Q2_9PSEU
MPLPTLIPAALSALALSMGPAATPGCELTLTVQTEFGAPVSATVTCDPVSGTHPDPTMVCDVLSKADGDFLKIPRGEAMFCPANYAPVTVTAKGDWHGKPVEFTHTYPNQCSANVSMGKIFSF